jgi:hypothetical protein
MDLGPCAWKNCPHRIAARNWLDTEDPVEGVILSAEIAVDRAYDIDLYVCFTNREDRRAR